MGNPNLSLESTIKITGVIIWHPPKQCTLVRNFAACLIPPKMSPIWWIFAASYLSKNPLPVSSLYRKVITWTMITWTTHQEIASLIKILLRDHGNSQGLFWGLNFFGGSGIGRGGPLTGWIYCTISLKQSLPWKSFCRRFFNGAILGRLVVLARVSNQQFRLFGFNGRLDFQGLWILWCDWQSAYSSKAWIFKIVI